MHTILTVTQVFLSIGLIGLVLIQHGRGADAGAAFGSGASATVFGARGSGSFLSRATGIIAALFFLTSMAMAYYAAKGGRPAGLMDGVNGMPVKTATKVRAPAPVPSGTGASPSGVPAVPGVTIPTAGADVPVAPAVQVPAPTPDVPGVPAAPQSAAQGTKAVAPDAGGAGADAVPKPPTASDN